MWDWLSFIFANFPYAGMFILGLLTGRWLLGQSHRIELQRIDVRQKSELTRLKDTYNQRESDYMEQKSSAEQSHKNELRRVHAVYNKVIDRLDKKNNE